jgi:C_GCAxxG_C_C family probable redox protein
MSKIDCAVDCFNRGFSCSQAVFSTYSEELGLDSATALRIAGAFGGGMGHIGETCGAVTGALMVIGLKYGKIQAEDNAAKEKTYALVQEFASRFKAKNDSISCKGLLGFDISTSEGMKAAREEGLFVKLCPQYVKDAAAIIEQLL